ncbi:MAG: flagellar biosynthetic protein FliR [Phycisphaerales bacterium]
MLSILLGLALILTRISSFFLVLPIFGWPAIPVQIKAAIAVILSVFFCACKPLGVTPVEISSPMAIILLASEAIYGLALGLIVALLFSVVHLSMQIAEQQMGLTMAEIVDPLNGEQAGALSSLVEMVFVLLFLSANGHHLFLQILSKSYDAFPPGTIPTIDLLVEGIISTGSAMFIASLRLTAPLLGAFLVLMVTLALLSRLVPEMDIFMVSIPARVALGLFLVAAFMPFVGGYITEMADWMAKLLPL